MQIALGRHSRVSIGDVSVANPAWAHASELLRVGLPLESLKSYPDRLAAVTADDAADLLKPCAGHEVIGLVGDGKVLLGLAPPFALDAGIDARADAAATGLPTPGRPMQKLPMPSKSNSSMVLLRSSPISWARHYGLTNSTRSAST